MSIENYDEIIKVSLEKETQRDVYEIMSMSTELTSTEYTYYCGSMIDEKVLLKELVTSGCEWMNVQKNVYGVSSVTKNNEKKLRKECKKYIVETNKPSGFIPAFVWAWAIKALIEWVVSKVIERMLLKEESKVKDSLRVLRNVEIPPTFNERNNIFTK